MREVEAIQPSVRQGLTESEVAERRATGRVNDIPNPRSRTVGQILRGNLFTPFNFLLGGLLVVIIAVGPLNDALFGGVLIANALIGIIQELRAKHTLDTLAVLSSPRAVVLRDGVSKEIAIGEVVLDEMLELRPGDQVVVDGRILESSGLEVDEGLLTGESDPVVRVDGDEVLSGSFVAAGSGSYQATRVGADGYASRLAAEARQFTMVRSELRNGINHIVRLISFAMVPTAALLLFNQLRQESTNYRDAVSGAVAGVVAMVPEGLVLLTSIAFALGVVRLGRYRALVQELPAVETLARVDVVCLDKTGTLTCGDITLEAVEPLGGADAADIASAVAGVVSSDPNPNATLRAVADAGDGGCDWQVLHAVPFSSARRWSGASFSDQGTWVLGAPDVVLDGTRDEPGSAGEPRRNAKSRAATCAATGQRVVLLSRASGALDEEVLPSDLVPQALILLDDKVRDEAPETLRYFADQDVSIKIISGDHPSTVAAIARRAGLELAGDAVDGRALASAPQALADAVETNSVFGRISPQQKRDMIVALKARGHVVGMTGDGVNDVLALKEADIGIAMGSGSPASRAAAQLVLLDGNFATLPRVVDEGRRVINNVERVANLFLTKTTYAMLIAIAVGVAELPFPFLPRHLTLVGMVTIGIPGFFLALAPNHRRAKTGFVSHVLRLAIPAGALAAAGTFAGYALARSRTDLSLDQARTTATVTLVGIGLFVLLRLARPLTPWKTMLVVGMAGLFALTLALPSGRTFFALALPPPGVAAAAGVIVTIVAAVMNLAAWAAVRYGTSYGPLLYDPDDGDRERPLST